MANRGRKGNEAILLLVWSATDFDEEVERMVGRQEYVNERARGKARGKAPVVVENDGSEQGGVYAKDN